MSLCLFCVETGGERVQAHHSRHAGGEDNGTAEIQDEHRQHHHQSGEHQPAEHGHRPAPQPLHSGQGETAQSRKTLERDTAVKPHVNSLDLSRVDASDHCNHVG